MDNEQTRAPRSAGRWVLSVLVIGAVAVAVVFVVSRTTDNGSSAPVTTVSPLTAEPIAKGKLVRTSKADGTLEYSDTLTVWHRIAGQKATAAAASASAASASVANASRTASSGNQAPGGGATRVVHPGSVVLSPSQASVPSTTVCTPSSSTVPPSPSTLAPAAFDPCSSPGGGSGGNSGGGATRPGGGAFSGGGSAAQQARVTQTVTSIAAVGQNVSNGDVLYTIDALPVVALSGALPAWRTLSSSSAAGADIRQLEEALIALGYDPDGTVTVDTSFDAKTTAMVKRWQAGLGITATGTVSLGSVVFIPRASTVASVARKVGDSVGDADEMLTLTGKNQRVVIDVPSGDEAYWSPGLEVTVGSGTGRVEVLRSVSSNSSAVVQAVIVPDAQIDGAGNGTTVSVSAELLIAADVFVVPSQALVSRVDGSYAVQVIGSGGSAVWVPVTLVGVAGLRAGVTGDGLQDGLSVLTPSA